MAASALNVSRLFGVAGKRVVVSGGGRGIGEMIAKTFVANGAHVFIGSRDAAACTDTAAKLTELGPGRCSAVAPANFGSDSGCRDFAAGVREQLEAEDPSTVGLEVLVNCSGCSWGQPLEDYSEKAWAKVFGLNVTGVFQLTRALLPLLDLGATPDDPSRVINIGSIAGIQPQPVPTYAYDASKAAVHHLTKKLAGELADRRPDGGQRITVNAVAPGFVPTKMSAQLLTYASKELIEQGIPLGKLGDEADMGGAAVYLASPASKWITGQVLAVDGGASSQPIAFSMPEASL